MDVGEAVGRPIPFASLLGIRLRTREPGHVLLELDLREALMNSAGTAHGGVLMTLLDVAMSIAARSARPDTTFAVTMEMKTSFIAPARGRMRVSYCKNPMNRRPLRQALSGSNWNETPDTIEPISI